MTDERMARLNALADRYGEGLTHFLVRTTIDDSAVSGRSRRAGQDIDAGTLIAVVGGIIMDQPDHYLAMPLGAGIYLHQVSNRYKGTVNHSCDPNCRIQGFNRLIARRDISCGEEITIDYGTLSVGKGHVIIEHCRCGAAACRHSIRSTDYLALPMEELGIYAKSLREDQER